ncbi:MAG TPA: hypothetical protein PL131_11765 [Methylotenera sp.]|nr:hypothetical protein [Methylotenera sp.]HPH06543.1 hypothetical protein [Methylotenera sp.]HPN01801.1 hypothetical protein [Methylotenera sp.]
MRIKLFFLRYAARILAVFTLVFFALAFWQGYAWREALAGNVALVNRSLAKHTVNPSDHWQAYGIGYLQAADNKPQLAARAFTYAEASNDSEIRARAKYALGNLYFGLAMKSANIEAGGAHQQAVAQIELAREAYKGAIRLKPELYDARYNLELLDRRSPERRTMAWKAETDGVTLQPFKRNGTAMMRDNARRGLP